MVEGLILLLEIQNVWGQSLNIPKSIGTVM